MSTARLTDIHYAVCKHCCLGTQMHVGGRCLWGPTPYEAARCRICNQPFSWDKMSIRKEPDWRGSVIHAACTDRDH